MNHEQLLKTALEDLDNLVKDAERGIHSGDYEREREYATVKSAILILEEYVRSNNTMTNNDYVHIEWSEHRTPNEQCPYTHCEATTPFGKFLLAWKSWKTGVLDMGIGFDETPWGEMWYGDWGTPDEAQRDAEEELMRRINLLTQGV